MNFYLMQVMSSHGVFNAYLFHMKLVESLECANCDRRERDDDDAWQTLLECPAFQLYWKDAMNTLQKMRAVCADGRDQVATFIKLIMQHKMEIAEEWQKRPIAAATHCPMPHLATHPSSGLLLATQRRKMI